MTRETFVDGAPAERSAGRTRPFASPRLLSYESSTSCTTASSQLQSPVPHHRSSPHNRSLPQPLPSLDFSSPQALPRRPPWLLAAMAMSIPPSSRAAMGTASSIVGGQELPSLHRRRPGAPLAGRHGCLPPCSNPPRVYKCCNRHLEKLQQLLKKASTIDTEASMALHNKGKLQP